MGLAFTPADVNDLVAEEFPAAYAEGNRCVDLGEGTALARWSFDAGKLRPGAYISGPTLFSLADCSLWFATFTVLGLEPMAVTSELSIRFLRPAQNGDVLARATLNSVSARRLVGTIEMWVDGTPDRLVAVAQGSYARP
ncbi:MAG: PaaI family thioesterase [Acidimicrobiia bacterium]